jgi:cytochrome c-type biogenesis protein CcmH/NrfG
MTKLFQRVFTCAAVITLFFLLSACGLSTGQADFEKGIALYNQGKYQESIQYLQKTVERDPEFVDAHLYLGRAYLATHQWAQSLAALRTAYRLSPDKTKGLIEELILDAVLGAASQSQENKYNQKR